MPLRAMVAPIKRISFPVDLGKSGGSASAGTWFFLFWVTLGLFVAGCTNLSEPAAFNPNQTGFASCHFAAKAHPVPFNRDEITYGESVRSRTAMTEAMRECLERLDAVASSARDRE